MTWSPRLLIRIAIGVFGLLVVVAVGIGLLMWSGRNTARAQSEFIVDFAASADAVVYCGNGYGLGTFSANEHPWWEWTLLGEMDPLGLASDLESELEERGFDIQPSDDAARTSIAFEGRHSGGMSVTAEIAHRMPQNNCFPDFGDVITDVNPSNYRTAAIVKFRDESRSR